MSRKIVAVQSCTSTIDVLRELAKLGAAAGTVVVAERQTHGRGQREHTFYAPSGGLYFSLLIRPEQSAEALRPYLTACVGVLVCDAMEALGGVRPSIKPVNDILLHGKKVAGILVNLVNVGMQVDYGIVSVGINLKAQAWPPELQDIAGSLEQLLGRSVDAELLLHRILDGVEALLRKGDIEAMMARYEADCIDS